jgi:hypothetical protein
MMTVASTVSTVLGSHSESKPSQPDDRWMATYPRESLAAMTTNIGVRDSNAGSNVPE